MMKALGGLCLLGALGACASFGGANDDLARRVDYLRQDVEALTNQQKALAEEVRKLTGSLPVTQATAPGAEPASEAALDLKDLAADPSATYKRAFDLMAQGQMAEAEAAFADFIAKFPQSDLADNAQYWIGECFYSQKNFKAARDAFMAVSVHFPFGNKVPDALYKEALCERQLGEPDKAASTLKRLAEEFPDSEAAAKARRSTHE